MRVAFRQTVNDEAQESVRLGEIEFSPLPGEPDSFSIEEHVLQRDGRSPLVVLAAYSLRNHSLSMFIKFEGEHVFTGMCHWDDIAPYFAFRLKDGSFIECYFAA
ncbi:MAG: hypothetical protein V7638_3265 [Acidobacteriota bacterium]|jgi:hypothetical protein